MPKSSDLGVWQTGQKRDYCVHHILIINYAILTLSNQDSNKFTKVWTKLFPLRSRHGKGIITTVLKGIKRKNNILSMIYDIQFDFFFPPTGKGTFFFSKYMWTDTKRYMMAFSFWFVLIYPNWIIVNEFKIVIYNQYLIHYSKPFIQNNSLSFVVLWN